MQFKKSKYGNKKTEIDGVVFDSFKEGNRFKELKLLQKYGEINELKLQEPFELIPALREPDSIGKRGGIKKGKTIENAVIYKADFVYFDNKKQRMIVEDSKGFKTKDYIIKRKLMKQNYPQFEFIES